MHYFLLTKQKHALILQPTINVSGGASNSKAKICMGIPMQMFFSHLPHPKNTHETWGNFGCGRTPIHEKKKLECHDHANFSF